MEPTKADSYPQMTPIGPEHIINCTDIFTTYPKLECDLSTIVCKDMQEIYKGFLAQLYFQCRCGDKEILPSFKKAVETFEAKCAEDPIYEKNVVEQQNRIRNTTFGSFFKYDTPIYYSSVRMEVDFIKQLNKHTDQYKSE